MAALRLTGFLWRQTWLKAGLLALLIGLITGCSQNFDGDDTAAKSLNEAGKALYESECASCHGANGSGGSGGPLVACATCGSTSSLVAKIEQDMPSASNPLRGGDAQDVADYIYHAFNESAVGTVERALPGVATMTPKESVHKLALELAGRLPTDEEVDEFTGSLEGEKSVVYGFMEEDYFYERLKDVFNDSFLTDKYRPATGGRLNDVYNKDLEANERDGNVFPMMDWTDRVLDTDGDGTNDFELGSNYLEHFSDEALGRKPLLMVEYLARNDRDFRELVSGKYTVVNAFSYRAFGGDTATSNVKVVNPDGSPNRGALPVVDNVEWDTFDDVKDLTEYLDMLNLVGRNQFGSGVDVNGGLTAQYVMEAFPYDPRDIKPVQLFYSDSEGNIKTGGVPHSGVLTDLVFLTKFTAMNTNRNRHRARMVYWFFAGKDLLAIDGNRDVTALELDEADNSVGVQDPTKTSEDCTVCHKIMDPVAQAYKHFRLDGLYQEDAELQFLQGDERPLVPGVQVGWAQANAQLNHFDSGSTNYSSREVQWLGEQIANDSAYAKGITQIVFKGLTGQDILGAPNPDSPENYRNNYAQQARLITNAASEFASSDFDIKALVYAITKSGYYRASGMYQAGLESEYDGIGSTRLLPPVYLNQKLRALNSGGWRGSVNLYRQNDRLFMGGKDSREVLETAESASGIIATLAEAMAVEEACDIIDNEFDLDRSERTLFKLVERSTDLENDVAINRRAEALAVRNTIAYLYLALLHEEVGINSEEVDIAFDLFKAVIDEDIDSGCNDARSTVEDAWYAVLVYLLNDYRFIYG
ncbi:c-type cytochrome [Saccharospirillum salsuginis]|uniref:Cytochrome c domain-containing protein n=1 Tax=Saccharospirillum salsuginis TaxID=418750 RepID=A0A918K5R9_9GAMM|nr:c-type cytochrome [Saccharospirillum salsuginis]GGX51046.1 hypothetical protein GCM10007392_17850 [Saccharospirillum salsuginis]